LIWLSCPQAVNSINVQHRDRIAVIAAWD
jgi:hypothetical protein